MIIEDSGEISVRTVWLTIVHMFTVLNLGVRNILLGDVHRKETGRD